VKALKPPAPGDDRQCGRVLAMGSDQFTATLAERILHWKACPDRFVKSGRAWIPRNRFRPLARVEDALLLLSHTASNYSLTRIDGLFTAEVRIGVRTGTASGGPIARTITLAIGRALGIEAPK
jgi:hypothetical protein